MKKDIHPQYEEATVHCSCGNTFTTRSTKKELHVELCSQCHPFYTGKQKLVDSGGRVDRFKKRLEKKADEPASRRSRPPRPRLPSRSPWPSPPRPRPRPSDRVLTRPDRSPRAGPMTARAELRVSLLQHTPDPDRAVAIAGRLCYAPVSAADLKQDMSDEDVAKLVRILVRSGHHSALEHATFSFAVDGVSRACTHQLVRHRVASYNQQSQRYVNFGAGDSFIVPPSISANAEAQAVFLQAMEDARVAYDKLVELGLAEGRKRGERPGGRPLRAAQRRRDQDRRHHERARAAPLLPGALLQPRPVGDPRPRLAACAAWSRSSPPTSSRAAVPAASTAPARRAR